MFNPTTAQSGFTLIELLMTVAIIAILLTLGYPSYETYLQQSRRTDGQMALFDLANRLENYYGKYGTYDGATLGSGDIETDLLSNNISAGGWYQLEITSQSNTSFLIQAIPQNAQKNDTLCQSLTLNNLGEKGISDGPNGAPTSSNNDCWLAQ